jgi:Mg2+ and Co2+ transporter CorA
VHPHQRPRLERYGDTLFCVLRTAHYVDESETVEFGEVHVFAGPHFVVTVRHGEAPDIAAVRRALESRPDLLRRGFVAILHAILDRVLDETRRSSRGWRTTSTRSRTRGMNFENMPEMTWDVGYPVALALMAILGADLYVLFMRRNWM